MILICVLHSTNNCLALAQNEQVCILQSYKQYLTVLATHTVVEREEQSTVQMSIGDGM